MDTVSILLVVLLVVVGSILLYWLSLRVRSGKLVGLRTLRGYDAMQRQVGRAVESGKQVHFGMGTGSLVGSASATSVAALAALDYLAKEGCASNVSPLVTMGDGTLLLAAQDSIRGGYASAGRARGYSPFSAQFQADSTLPMNYAAGASDVINRANVSSNLILGHIGPELAIIAEAADRRDLEQIIGSDDPPAMGVAMALTDRLLIGEELFASGAYLSGEPAQIASLQLQDVLRVIAMVGILLAALFGLVVS